MASHPTSTAVSSESTGERGKLQLYSYCGSSCSWRVRIALNLKGLKYEYKAVNIYEGEQFNPEFLKLNPLGLVPVLVDDDVVVSDSFAIILYLEQKYPQHPLLPDDPQKRALNLQIANIVCSSIQPYQNIPVLSYIKEKVSHDEQFSWVEYHIGKGFKAIMQLLEGTAGKYATGDEVFLAGYLHSGSLFRWMNTEMRTIFKHPLGDLFLLPQIYAAINRFNLDMAKFPLLLKLREAYDALPAFRAAMPDMQPDAVKV